MSFNTIVVGIDFSERSLATARWVAHHLPPGAQLIFVHVVSEPETPSFLRPHLTGMLDNVSGIAPALIPGLRGVADLIARGRHRIEIVSGIAADGLAQVAADAGADLICLGRRRLRRGGARFGATTAHRLLARTRVPVLIVPGGDHSTPTRILAALDSRDGGDAIARGAARLADSWEAHVDAVHVLSPHLRDLVHSSRTVDANADSAITNGVESTADLFRLTREWLEQQTDVAGIPPARARACVSVGDAGQEIIRTAHLSRANLITMGRGTSSLHTTPPIGILPLGSTTRHVMWAAPCPVLVLPTNSVTQQESPSWRMTRMRSGQSSPARRFVSAPDPDPLPPAARSGVAVCDCCPTPQRSTH
jgi:nucleotide-binding universal stress UspA family protein